MSRTYVFLWVWTIFLVVKAVASGAVMDVMPVSFDDPTVIGRDFTVVDLRGKRVSAPPFQICDNTLVWNNVRSEIAMILFRNYAHLRPSDTEDASVHMTVSEGSWGASCMGLAVFSSMDIVPEQRGNGYVFMQRKGELVLKAWEDGRITTLALPEIRVAPGVGLKIDVNHAGVYTFSYKQDNDDWKAVFTDDRFTELASRPERAGVYASSGWWKGSVVCSDFSLRNAWLDPVADKPVGAWILCDSEIAGSMEAWQRFFARRGVRVIQKQALQSLDGKTSLAGVQYIVIDLSRIHQDFARSLERWVKDGGIAIIGRSPGGYTRESAAPGLVAARVRIDGELARIHQGLMRITGAGPFGKGVLREIIGPKESIAYQSLADDGHVIPEVSFNVFGLHLLTGFPDRDFGSMRLLSAKVEDDDGEVREATVAIRKRYGKGRSYYTTLPIVGGGVFADALREALLAQMQADDQSNDVEQRIYNSPPGEHVATPPVVETPPERPAPPEDCLLELQGDQFTRAMGSPAWAPWRIALANSDEPPIEKTFVIDPPGPLWMEIQGAYGDHREPPVMDVEFNGHRLMRQAAPWRHIPATPDSYHVLYPVRFHIPASLLKKENTLSIRNLGLEWFILDYVRFFAADGERSLERVLENNLLRQNEYQVHPGASVTVDGHLDEAAWDEAVWTVLDGNPKRLDEAPSDENAKAPPYRKTEFAMVADTDTLYVGTRTMAGTVAELALGHPDGETNYVFSWNQDGLATCLNTDGEIIDTPGIEVAAEELDDGTWSFEAAIPLTLVPGTDAATYRPNSKTFLPMGRRSFYNLFRRTRLERDAAEWESLLPFRYFGESKTLLTRTGKKRVPYLFMYENIEDATLFVPAPPSSVTWPERMTWGVNTVSVVNLDGGNSRARVVVRAPDEVRAVHEFDLDAGANALSFPLWVPGRSEVTVQQYDEEGRLTALAMQPVEVQAPLRIRAGRHYYTSEATASLQVEFLYPEAATELFDRIAVEVCGPEGRVHRFDRVVTGETMVFEFSISDWPPGCYATTVSAAVAGRRFSQPSPDIVIHPPAATEVKLRADGVMLVNEKPIFPMGMLLDQYRVNGDLAFVKDGGLNTVVLWQGSPETAGRKAAEAGLHLILSTTGTHGGAGNWMVDHHGARKHLEKARNQPAVIGYYPVDEPEYWHAPNCVPLQLLRFNEFAAKIDPYRPSMISHGVGHIHYGRSEGLTFNDAVDLRLYEVYSRPSSLAGRMDQVRSFGKRDRAVPWAFLRIGASPRHSMVSSVQFRAEGYTAFVCGYRGIVYFLQRMALWNGAEHWPEVCKAMSDEIQIMAASRMKESTRVVDVASPSLDIRVSAWIDDDAFWLAAVNVEDEPQAVEVSLDTVNVADQRCEPLFTEMDVLPIVNGVARIDLPAYGVGCWKIPRASTGKAAPISEENK